MLSNPEPRKSHKIYSHLSPYFFKFQRRVNRWDNAHREKGQKHILSMVTIQRWSLRRPVAAKTINLLDLMLWGFWRPYLQPHWDHGGRCEWKKKQETPEVFFFFFKAAGKQNQPKIGNVLMFHKTLPYLGVEGWMQSPHFQH